jgi:adenylate cyclase
MVEEIITALSRIKWLFVIARNSSFTYKGQAVDVKQVGRELGVRYVLEGSVRKGGNRVRITAQLIDATNGAHLWADRFDGSLEEVFELQDKVAISVAGVIEPTLRQSEIERARRKRPDSLDAYDLYLRALPDAFATMPEDADKALALLGKAIELEPDFAAAHAIIVFCHEQRYLRGGMQEETRIAEPGGICVSARVQEDSVGKLELAFEDIGEQQLKNIARPVRVYRIRLEAPVFESRGTLLPLPDKPSVAVLPFTNMSGAQEQEYLADGMAEDIITALSRYPSLFVIARNSCFTYKGRAVDVRQIGRELGVRYVLEGSMRKAGNRVRLTAQLVEAETGKHVWAERYDRDLADIFVLQDDITEAVTIAVAPAIAHAEQQRAVRKPPGSLDAWAAYQRGFWHWSKFSADDNALAQKFFQQAIDLDPTFGGGYRGLAMAQLVAAGGFQTRNLAETLTSAEALARRAVALDGADAEAHSTLGATLCSRGDYEGALAEAERALAISPNLAGAHATLGATRIFSGRPKEGLAALKTSIRLDPHDPTLPSRLNRLALGRYFSGEYEAAVEAAKRAIRLNPDYPLPYRWLAAALGQMGRTAEAKETLPTAIAVAPASFDMYVRGRVPWMRPEDHAHMLEGLRKAGWEG